MLTAALDGLVERFALEGERLGEVVAGAVLKHARDRDLTRECVLGIRLAPETPAYDVQQACGTGLETVDRWSPTRSRSARSTPASPAASTPPPTRRSRVNEDLRADPARRSTARSRCPARAQHAHAAAARARSCPRSRATRSRAPASRWASTRRSWPPSGGSRARSRTSSRSRQPPATSPPPTSAASSTTWSRRTSGSSATRTCARTPRVEKLAKLKPVFGGADGTMTAGNSTPLTDGAVGGAAGERGVGAGARPAGARLLRRRADRRGRPRAQAARGC